MLTQQQYQKLQGMGLSQNQINQVTQAAGGVQEKKSLGGFIGNVAESGINLVGDTAKSVLNPVETVKNLISLVKDPMVLVNYYKNRYGKDLGETLYNDPVGVLSDLSALIGGGAGALKLGTNIATKGAKVVDLSSDLAKLGRASSKLGKISSVIDPLQAAGNLIGKTTSKAISKTAGALDDMGVDTLIRSYKLSKTDIEKIANALGEVNPANYRNKVANYIIENGITGGSSKTGMENIASKIKPIQESYNQLTRSGKAISPSVYADEIYRLASELDNPINPPVLQNMVKTLEQEAYRVANLKTPITDVDITNLKKTLYKKVPTSALTDPGISSVVEGLGQSIINTLERQSPGSQKIGQQLKGLRTLQERVGRTGNTGAGTQLFNAFKPSFSGLTSGYILSGGNLAGAMAGGVGSVIANSPKIQEKVGRTMLNLSKNKINVKVPPRVKSATTGLYAFGRAGRMVNPQTNQPTSQKKQQIVPDVLKQKLPSQVQKSNTSSTDSLPDLTKTFKKNPFRLKKGSFY